MNGLHGPILLSGCLLTTVVPKSLRLRDRGCSVAMTSSAPRVQEAPTGHPLNGHAATRLGGRHLSCGKGTAEASSHSDLLATVLTTINGWKAAHRVRPHMSRAAMTEGSNHLVQVETQVPTRAWKTADQHNKESSGRPSITTRLAFSNKPGFRRVRRKCEGRPGTPPRNAMGARRARKNMSAAMATATDGPDS